MFKIVQNSWFLVFIDIPKWTHADKIIKQKQYKKPDIQENFQCAE